MKCLKYSDLEAYKQSFSLSNDIWKIVSSWSYLDKDTVGKQLIRAADSISANIAEGFGRFGKKDKIKFYYYSRASVFEALDWNNKAKKRALLTEKEFEFIASILEKLPKEINALIQFTTQKLST